MVVDLPHKKYEINHHERSFNLGMVITFVIFCWKQASNVTYKRIELHFLTKISAGNRVELLCS